MSLQSPPSITPRQMTLLRIVSSMAWSDGHLATEEVDVMLKRLSQLFGTDPQQQTRLQEELREYLMQNLPLESLIPKLDTPEERELVLKLGYEVICSSARTPDEPHVNAEEAAAYQRLIQLLNLPAETVQRIEAEVTTAPPSQDNIVELLVVQLEAFFQT